MTYNKLLKLPKILLSSSFQHVAAKHSWPAGGENKPIPKLHYPVREQYRAQLESKEWQSALSYFKPADDFGTNLLLKLHKGYDLRLKNFPVWFYNTRLKKLEDDQKFNYMRMKILGWDLAAAHFLLFRRGRIRFKDSKEWLDDYEKANLPMKFEPDLLIEAIDASDTRILYEGLENFENLNHLKYADFSACEYIDDFCIDRICGMFYNTVEHLNISQNTNITARGLIALARLRKLKYLNITGLEHIKEFPLICMNLEDENPGLYIEGSPHPQLTVHPYENSYIQ